MSQPQLPFGDDATLHDIVSAAERVIKFISGMSFAAFLADDKTQSAILYQILVMGEATKRLSTETRSAGPAIPWREIAGMRDRLIHAYDLVDWEEVWSVAQHDVPELLTNLAPLSQGRSR